METLILLLNFNIFNWKFGKYNSVFVSFSSTWTALVWKISAPEGSRALLSSLGLYELLLCLYSTFLLLDFTCDHSHLDLVLLQQQQTCVGTHFLIFVWVPRQAVDPGLIHSWNLFSDAFVEATLLFFSIVLIHSIHLLASPWSFALINQILVVTNVIWVKVSIQSS